MSEPITPALTPDEWKDAADITHNSEDHAAAALFLYQQPFGFTQDDVDVLLREWEYRCMKDDDPIKSIADRIAALLPPSE